MLQEKDEIGGYWRYLQENINLFYFLLKKLMKQPEETEEIIIKNRFLLI
jgi:hypothetical protein